MAKGEAYFDFYKEKLINYKLYKSYPLKEMFDETVQEEAELIKKYHQILIIKHICQFIII